ncbi:MAG: hypothetical protein KAH44_29550 [Oricola sp.]|jgi:hypothetical protein|uniref:hypothetical protein n=1 Tax=Hyphococcus sp. TaxID=2038636 RepID=UPI00320BE9A5|nr:hypothetical protein [Oricola sp.]
MTHNPKSYQFDLFASQASDGAAKTPPLTPPWPKLPEKARQTLTLLMTRLILDHASQDDADTPKGAAHDDV